MGNYKDILPALFNQIYLAYPSSPHLYPSSPASAWCHTLCIIFIPLIILFKNTNLEVSVLIRCDVKTNVICLMVSCMFLISYLQVLEKSDSKVLNFWMFLELFILDWYST